MSDKRITGLREYEAAMEDGPKYAQHPDEYFPVAYRISVTGIYLATSRFDPDEVVACSGESIVEIVEMLVHNRTADIRLYRLTDAPEVTEEQKAEWQAERLRKAQEAIDYDEEMRRQRTHEMITEPDRGSFSEMTDLVTGIYKTQGILPSKEDG